MDKFKISVALTGELCNFQVVNNSADKCEHEVFAGSELVAVFERDENEYIHICQNPTDSTKKLSFKSPTALRHTICNNY